MSFVQYYRPRDEHINPESDETASVSSDEQRSGDGSDSSSDESYRQSKRRRASRSKTNEEQMIERYERTRRRERRALHAAPLEKYEQAKIKKRLRLTVLHQEIATEQISSTMAQIKQRRQDILQGRCRENRNIFITTLAGPSGVGKTETVLRCCHELGMDKGYANERNYIFLTGRSFNNETHNTAASGAGAGYEGHDEKKSVADQLMACLESPLDALIKSLPKHSLERAKMEQKRREGLLSDDPPYICLFIDEFDKAHSSFVQSVIGLFDTGRIKNSHGEEFQLPRNTILVIFLAANYGAEALCRLEDDHFSRAQSIIRGAMIERGLTSDMIGRMGTLIVFFKLSEENFIKILQNKLVVYMKTRNEQYAGQLGAIQCDDETRAFLIHHVLNTMYGDGGVRVGLKDLFNNLDTLFQDAISSLPVEEKSLTVRQLSPPLALSAKSKTASATRAKLATATLHSSSIQKHVLDLSDIRLSMSREAVQRQNPDLDGDEAIRQRVIRDVKEDVTREITRYVGDNIMNLKLLDTYERRGENDVKAISLARNGRPINVNILPLIDLHVNCNVNVEMHSQEHDLRRIEVLEERCETLEKKCKKLEKGWANERQQITNIMKESLKPKKCFKKIQSVFDSYPDLTLLEDDDPTLRIEYDPSSDDERHEKKSRRKSLKRKRSVSPKKSNSSDSEESAQLLPTDKINEDGMCCDCGVRPAEKSSNGRYEVVRSYCRKCRRTRGSK